MCIRVNKAQFNTFILYGFMQYCQKKIADWECDGFHFGALEDIPDTGISDNC